MAKFTIALCILLIAFTSGDENSDSSGIMGQLTSTLTSYVTSGQTGMNTILESMKNATNAAAVFDNLLKSTTEIATAEYEEVITSISSNSTGTPSSCTSLRIDFQNLAMDVASNTITCVYEILADILSGGNTTLAEFIDAMNELNDIGQSIRSCTSNNGISMSCVTPIWTSVTGDAAMSWAQIVADVAILSTKFSTIQASIGSCGVVGITKTVASQTQASYSEVQKCIDDLSSTSS